jgi:nicotinate-nucleotide adenylyltransferase
VKKKKTGLLFGSFNPVHIGHLVLANYFLEFSDLDEVRFIVSPHNPLKEESSLLPETERLKMMLMAVEDVVDFSVSDVEFHLPKPSYTAETLKYLTQNEPNNQFVLIIGEDNLTIFDQWKDYNFILDNYKIYVYNRFGCVSTPFHYHPNVIFFQAPLLNISSSFIRQSIKDGKNIRFFLPEKVYYYIKEKQYYHFFQPKNDNN